MKNDDGLSTMHFRPFGEDLRQAASDYRAACRRHADAQRWRLARERAEEARGTGPLSTFRL